VAANFTHTVLMLWDMPMRHYPTSLSLQTGSYPKLLHTRHVNHCNMSYTLILQSIYILLFLSCCSQLEQRASVKRFVSLQLHDHFADDRTPWTGDQPVARPIPKRRTTQTYNKFINTNVQALCGIRTHEPGFQASEDNKYLTPPGYRDRPSSP
jgi:hypothetical protein